MGSLTIDIHELEELKRLITTNKLTREAVKSKYELLRIKEDDISIIVYKSGKLVHNDTDSSKNIVESVLKKDTKYDYILGSDETGKGEWFGPLVVVATALTPEQIVELRKLGVQDSKNFKKQQLLKIAANIINKDFVRHSIPITPKTYNRLYDDFRGEGKNLNDMMAWAHSVVIKDTLDKIDYGKAKVVIDKFDFEKTEYRLENVEKTNLKIIQKTKGESEIPVAAASIIAKYLYEREVDKLNDKYRIDLRKSKPEDINPEILPLVAKLHFKNVSECL